MNARLEAVIFDLDGLLVDSEPLQFKAYRKAFADFDIDFERTDWQDWHRLEASAARWLEARELDADAEAVRARKKLYYDQLIAAELRLKPGARALVEASSDRFRLCVASGSRPESIAACLERFGLGGHFEQQFSATLLKRKKPFPDVYFEALSQMGVAADQALAIEDSVAGLEAACAAGIACIVCPDRFLNATPASFDRAALLVDSLERLSPGLLSQTLATNKTIAKKGTEGF